MSIPIQGYGQAAETYWHLGYRGVLPLPPGQKQWPPRGFTGEDGDYPSFPDVQQWRELYPDGNIALRMADDQLGIDVDHYDGKTGGTSIAKAEAKAELGALPYSPRSTSRAPEDPISSIRLYRVPAGRTWKWPEERFGGGIDILQRHHRYAVVWPSIHPSGKLYRWIGADGEPTDPPSADDLPELPDAWVEALSQPAVPDVDYGTYPVSDTLTAGEPEGRVRHILERAIKAVHGQAGSRYDATRDNVLALLRCGKDGDHGVQRAIELIRFEYVQAVAEKRRGGARIADMEFDRMISGKRVAKLLAVPSHSDWFEASASSASALPAAVFEPSGSTDEDTPMTDPQPTPLTTTVAVPKFPTAALPEAIGDKVAALALATQTDEAMVGTCGLSALAACTGGHAVIEIRRGWREPLNMFFDTVAAPGERKSAVQQSMIGPILAAENSMAFDSETERLHKQDQVDTVKAKAAKLKTEAAKAAAAESKAKIKRDLAEGADNIEAATRVYNLAVKATKQATADAEAALTDLRAIEVPPIPRLVADDCTPEAAASLLAEHGGRIAILSAEGGIFDTIAGRYARTVNLDVYLKGHAGDPIIVDRQGRPPQRISKPAITFGLMTQPRVLEVIGQNPDFSGRGFLARFMYARPTSNVGHRAIAAAPVSEEIESTYRHLIHTLASQMSEWVGDPAVLILSPEAESAFQAIEARIETSLGSGGELASSPGLIEWGAKYAGAIARIAGNLHLAKHGASGARGYPVQPKTIADAFRIGEYFRACAVGVFTEMVLDPGTRDAVYLIKRIVHLGDEEVSQRDLHAKCRSRFPKADDLAPVINRLIEHGWLIPLKVDTRNGTVSSKAGRPPSPRYRVHESAFEKFGGR